VLTGRDPLSSAAVAKRLEASGFPVHFMLFGEAGHALHNARRAGLSCSSAVVEAEGKRPQSVMVSAAPA
jgi:hypothetical protein